MEWISEVFKDTDADRSNLNLTEEDFLTTQEEAEKLTLDEVTQVPIPLGHGPDMF